MVGEAGDEVVAGSIEVRVEALETSRVRLCVDHIVLASLALTTSTQCTSRSRNVARNTGHEAGWVWEWG